MRPIFPIIKISIRIISQLCLLITNYSQFLPWIKKDCRIEEFFVGTFMVPLKIDAIQYN